MNQSEKYGHVTTRWGAQEGAAPVAGGWPWVGQRANQDHLVHVVRQLNMSAACACTIHIQIQTNATHKYKYVIPTQIEARPSGPRCLSCPTTQHTNANTSTNTSTNSSTNHMVPIVWQLNMSATICCSAQIQIRIQMHIQKQIRESDRERTKTMRPWLWSGA